MQGGSSPPKGTRLFACGESREHVARAAVGREDGENLGKPARVDAHPACRTAPAASTTLTA